MHIKSTRMFFVFAMFISTTCIGYQHKYAAQKRLNKEHGFIIIDNENRIFFVPSATGNLTLRYFLKHHKEDGIWIRGDYSDASMDSIRSAANYLPITHYGRVDTFGFTPVYIEYCMVERVPDRIHDRGVYNCVFYLESSRVKFNYFEAQYKISTLKLSHK